MKVPFPHVAALPLALALALSPAAAGAAGFVYEGRLDDGGMAANGRYDLRLSPFVDAKSTAALAAPLVFEDVPVVEGRFRIDFDLPLATTTAAWIEVGVRDGSAVGGFSTIPGRSEAASAKAIGACWSSTGDSATNPAVNFLGTTDAQPLVLRVQNQQAVRYEPTTASFNGAPLTNNVVAGSPLNGLFTGVQGGVIAGGGVPPDSDPNEDAEGPNRINDHFGTIGGGHGNLAGDNLIPTDSARGATVAGGLRNQASGTFAAIGGGFRNTINVGGATIAGGSINTASGDNATIGGGQLNLAEGDTSVIAGGTQNTTTASQATISGGRSNVVSGNQGTVAGGSENEILGSTHGAILGGRLNIIAGGADAFASTIAGGNQNQVAPGVQQAFIGGGRLNFVSAPSGGTVIGGYGNQAAGFDSTTSGGRFNCAGGTNSWAGGAAARVRVATGTTSLPSVGCTGVQSSGDTNGDEGTFVWSGGNGITSTGPNQFIVSASGGAVINSNDPAGNALRVNGLLRVDTLGASGSSTLCRNASNQISGCSSSARYKQHITELDLGLSVVERLRPVAYEWKQTHEADIGFVAEEIAAIDPRLVTRNAQGQIEGVKYERLTAVLAAALQESNARHALALETAEARHAEALALRDAALRRMDARLRALESPAANAAHR